MTELTDRLWNIIRATEGFVFVDNGRAGKKWKHFTFRGEDNDAEKLATFLNAQSAELDRITLSLKKLNEENTENLDEIDRLTGEVSRLERDQTKLKNLRHNHAALHKEHDEWKGAVKTAASDKAKADALAEAAEKLVVEMKKQSVHYVWRDLVKPLCSALTAYRGDK